VFRLYGDNQRARALLDWEPQVSLDQGLRRTIDWIAQHLDQYDPTRYQV
jgi:dTDP-glucose 4,6-dehydratase